ncbi:hypothetical protein [Haloechinothrix salitolerans]|uniref:Lipoprotein n=1 Tax=Haloechinothrix salitolerans TaxID=926830 RepID=A0ABW2BZ91_9PSEU
MLTRAALVVLAALAASGCTAPASPSELPPLGEVPVIRDADDLAALDLPLDPYHVDTEPLLDRMNRAWDVLVQRCIRRYGLSWPTSPEHVPPEGPEHMERYGIIDAAVVTEYGYHQPPRPGVKNGEDTGQSWSADADAVMTGRVDRHDGKPVPNGGCNGEAMRALGAELPENGPPKAPLSRRLAGRAYEQALADPRLDPVVAEWRECMTAAGYDYDSPLDAGEDRAWYVKSGPSKREIATALADVDCRARTNYVGMFYALDAAYQREAVAAHRAELRELREAAEVIDRNARRLLGE